MKSTVTCERASNAGRHAFQIACLVTSAMAVVVTGCASGPAKAIRERMVANSDDYRRVQVLPVWFAASGVEGSSLTTNDLRALEREIGTNLVKGLSTGEPRKSDQPASRLLV